MVAGYKIKITKINCFCMLLINDEKVKYNKHHLPWHQIHEIFMRILKKKIVQNLYTENSKNLLRENKDLNKCRYTGLMN